jgi:hypothetical protein
MLDVSRDYVHRRKIGRSISGLGQKRPNASPADGRIISAVRRNRTRAGRAPMLASTAVSGRSPKTEFCSPARGRSPLGETIPYCQYLRAYRRSAPNRPRLPQARSARRKTLIVAVEALADSLRLQRFPVMLNRLPLPGLTRQSIPFARRWMRGSRPRMTAESSGPIRAKSAIAIYLCELISLHQQRAIGIGRLSALARVLAGQPFQSTQ